MVLRVVVMRMFVKVGDERRHLADIQLKDSFSPCIGDPGKDVPSHILPPMEPWPAIWCKVLILDSVLIDCNQRTLRWSTETAASDGGFKLVRVSKTKSIVPIMLFLISDDEENWQSLNEDISEYDDEDELFDLARDVADRTSSAEASNVCDYIPVTFTIYCYLQLIY